MRWERVIPAAAAVIVVVVAAIGYVMFVPVHHVERTRLSRLVVAHPPAGYNAKAGNSGQVAATSSPFAEVKAAAKRSPDSTGSYSIEWTATKSTTNGASLLVSMLPSQSDAAVVLKQARQGYLDAGSFKTEKYAFAGPFAVPAVQGASGSLYVVSSKTDDRLAVVAFPEGRFVVVLFVQQTGAAKAEADATSLAEAQLGHLQQVGQDFSLRVTTYPTVTTIVYWVVTGLIVVAILAVPPGIRRRRRHRLRAREEAARREFRGRGKKIARHHAARRR
jgi:hypothetical protein